MNRLQELNQVIAEAEQELEGMPEGRLKAMGRYYQYCSPNETRYLHAPEDEVLLYKLERKQYLEKIVRSAKKEKNAILTYRKNCPAIPYEKIYNSLPPQRQELLQPWKTPRQKWEQEPYPQKRPPDSSAYLCPNGLHVRSKSEVLIVSRLLHYDVPFRYECRVYLKGYGTVFPDFTIFLPQSSRTILYEHFGRIDDPEYAQKTLKKLHLYQRNQYIPGINLFFTTETLEHPLSMETIDELISTIFKKC